MMKTVLRLFSRSCLVGVVLLALPLSQGIAAEKIRIATAGLAASSAAVWAALETKTFQKHGLEVEYIIIDNGTVGGQALLAGELQVLVSTEHWPSLPTSRGVT
jgi:ABC-type nitrate/sulfonate/bicarbonate transport system substrate-binding protein